MTRFVLAVGLNRHSLGLLAESLAERAEPVAVVPCSDAASARRWLGKHVGAVPLVIVAVFREDEAWGLTTLFSWANSLAAGTGVEVLLFSDLPVAALPVLITDIRGLRTIVPGSAADLRTHLDLALQRWPAIAAG